MTRSQRGDAASVGDASHSRTDYRWYGSARRHRNPWAHHGCLSGRSAARSRSRRGRALEDGHYVYFGACLPELARDIDMNVHQGRFMVRLAKLAEDSDLD